MGDLQQALATYGPIVIALGAAVEGPATAIAGGVLAHQHLVPPWLTFACAAGGSGLTGQALFLAGRRYRSAEYVIRAAQTRAFAMALTFVERYPVSYIFAFRYLFGLRAVSPIAMGVSQIPALTFALLNAASALAWAAVFTGLGYWFGQTIETTLSRYKNVEHRLAAAAVVLAGALVLFYLGRWAWPHLKARFRRAD